MSTNPINKVPPPRPMAMQIITDAKTPTNSFQGWLRSVWNMLNGTVNQGFTGSIVISGTTLVFQNGVLMSHSP